jgi:hypothetical protein
MYKKDDLSIRPTLAVFKYSSSIFTSFSVAIFPVVVSKYCSIKKASFVSAIDRPSGRYIGIMPFGGHIAPIKVCGASAE